MLLYKTTSSSTQGKLWSSSGAAAAKDREKLRKEGGKDVDTVKVDVSTTKQGLLDLLNGAHVQG